MVPDELLKYKGQPGFEYLDNFGNGTKTCTKCKEFKDKALFTRDSSKKDGLSQHCRECRREQDRKRAQRNVERNAGKPKDENYHKTCPKCGVTKSSMGFCRNRSTTDGLQRWCKGCARKGTQAFYEDNPDYQRKYNEKERKRNEMTRAVAAASGSYSPEEDLVVLNSTLTMYQRAIKLGRTSSSVKRRKITLKKKGVLTVEDLKKSLA